MSSIAHLYTWNAINIQFPVFVTIKMATYCVGCGGDISEARVKRSLYSDASRHVMPLWSKLFDEELANRGMETLAHSLVTSTTGKICRRCFVVFERATKLLNSIKQDVAKAVEAFQQNGLLTLSEEAVRDCASAPPFKRLAIATDSTSPAVVVSMQHTFSQVTAKALAIIVTYTVSFLDTDILF